MVGAGQAGDLNMQFGGVQSVLELLSENAESSLIARPARDEGERTQEKDKTCGLVEQQNHDLQRKCSLSAVRRKRDKQR